MFTKESSNRSVMDFKIALNEAIAFAEEKQETLALRLGVTQGQINNWCNPNSERNFPMALFPVLPVRMRKYLMDYLNKRCGAIPDMHGLNGSVDDELVAMIMLERDLKLQSESDPKKAKKTILKMREVLDRAELEVNTINN